MTQPDSERRAEIARAVTDAVHERWGMCRTTHVCDYADEIGEMAAEVAVPVTPRPDLPEEVPTAEVVARQIATGFVYGHWAGGDVASEFAIHPTEENGHRAVVDLHRGDLVSYRVTVEIMPPAGPAAAGGLAAM